MQVEIILEYGITWGIKLMAILSVVGAFLLAFTLVILFIAMKYTEFTLRDYHQGVSRAHLSIQIIDKTLKKPMKQSFLTLTFIETEKEEFISSTLGT